MTLGDRIVVLHSGRIQQQGSAEELYKTPVNRFVAGFLGSPPMNFFDGTLGESDGHLTVSGEDYRLPLPESMRARTQQLRSKEVIVGIRPSAFSIADDSGNGVLLDLPVVLPEYIGSQSVIVSRLGGQQIQIEVSSDTPLGANEMLTFNVDPNNIYLFDPHTEATL